LGFGAWGFSSLSSSSRVIVGGGQRIRRFASGQILRRHFFGYQRRIVEFQTMRLAYEEGGAAQSEIRVICPLARNPYLQSSSSSHRFHASRITHNVNSINSRNPIIPRNHIMATTARLWQTSLVQPDPASESRCCLSGLAPVQISPLAVISEDLSRRSRQAKGDQRLNARDFPLGSQFPRATLPPSPIKKGLL
jgi:hypothetical protein